ncbi:hypothetical protein H0H92_009602 [Tricholoma furcatifolium]|nr:hypothetical protein H0H92_009602 [Tricholoma furcatifolium]
MSTIVDSTPVIPICSGETFRALYFSYLLTDENSIPATVCPDCELPTDIALKSSDGTLFGAHRAELAKYPGFMPMDMPRIEGDSDIVEMPEQYSSTTLKYMLAYMHPNRPSPDIRALTILDIESLARAVQLHEVYRGIENCRLRMDNPLAVFRYAAEHRDRYLLKKAVPYTIDETFATMKRNIINLAMLAAWVEYREGFINCSNNLMAPATPGSPHITNNDSVPFRFCASWDEFYKDVQHEFLGKPLSQVGVIVNKHLSKLLGCKECTAKARALVPNTTYLSTIFDTL